MAVLGMRQAMLSRGVQKNDGRLEPDLGCERGTPHPRARARVPRPRTNLMRRALRRSSDGRHSACVSRGRQTLVQRGRCYVVTFKRNKRAREHATTTTCTTCTTCPPRPPRPRAWCSENKVRRNAAAFHARPRRAKHATSDRCSLAASVVYTALSPTKSEYAIITASTRTWGHVDHNTS